MLINMHRACNLTPVFTGTAMNNPDQVEAGQAVYTPAMLNLYDWWVLGFSNRFLWHCPTIHLEAMYDRNVSDRHLDIGVGTGYFLDRASWPVDSPQITLADLNPNSLQAAKSRISRFDVQAVTANIFEPLPLKETYKSIATCYLLHCLPDAMTEKAPVVFNHVFQVLDDNGKYFGATILQGNTPRSALAQKLMNFYNGKGIFSNRQDGLQDLQAALNNRFSNVRIRMQGVVAIFEATK